MANPTLPSDIEFVNEQERQYFAEAVIGEEVRQFLVSDTGRYLHGRAKQEYDRCRDLMFDLDPYTPQGKQEFLKLKADAAAAAHFLRWCVEAISLGEQSAVMLENYREEA
ncbi:MAG: hypothetical protein ACYSTZ_06375 [Planctomycetota bacterium]|jgi:hypothetical protein